MMAKELPPLNVGDRVRVNEVVKKFPDMQEYFDKVGEVTKLSRGVGDKYTIKLESGRSVKLYRDELDKLTDYTEIIKELKERVELLEGQNKHLTACEAALVECRALILAPQDAIAEEWGGDVIGFPSAIPMALKDRLNSHLRDFWMGFRFTRPASIQSMKFWTDADRAAMYEFFGGHNA
jgi:signal peptidase I